MNKRNFGRGSIVIVWVFIPVAQEVWPLYMDSQGPDSLGECRSLDPVPALNLPMVASKSLRLDRLDSYALRSFLVSGLPRKEPLS